MDCIELGVRFETWNIYIIDAEPQSAYIQREIDSKMRKFKINLTTRIATLSPQIPARIPSDDTFAPFPGPYILGDWFALYSRSKTSFFSGVNQALTLTREQTSITAWAVPSLANTADWKVR